MGSRGSDRGPVYVVAVHCSYLQLLCSFNPPTNPHCLIILALPDSEPSRWVSSVEAFQGIARFQGIA
jgi:hypothetical protein